MIYGKAKQKGRYGKIANGGYRKIRMGRQKPIIIVVFNDILNLFNIVNILYNTYIY